MKLRGTFALLVAVIAIAMFTGCSRDPNVRKAKYLGNAERYFSEAKYNEAGIELSNAIKIDANYAAAHYKLGQVYRKLQKWPAAYQEFTRTLDIDPQNFDARVDLASLLIETGDLQQAEEQRDTLLQQRPNDGRSHFIAASLLAARGNFPPAIVEMQKAIALKPDDWDFYMNLGLMQMKNNQPDEAEANLKQAVALNSTELNASLMLATYYESRDRFTEAERELQRAIAIAPRSVDARSALARLYLVEGNKREEEAFLTQVKKDFPDNSLGYRMLGDYYFTSGDLEKATAEYASLYAQYPKDLDVKKNYVQLLIMNKQLGRATQIDDEILKASPSDVGALGYRGQLQLLAGNANAAVETLQGVLRSDPNQAAAHYQLGLAFQALGNMRSAETEWREAIRLNPNMIDAQRTLALFAMRSGDMGTLEQAAGQMIELQPQKPEGYALRSIAEINQKKFEAAQRDIQKTIEIAPNSQLGYVQLGNLELVKKNYPAAQAAFQHGLDRDSNSIDALRGLLNSYLAQNQVDRAIAAANAQIAKSPANSSFYDLLGTALFRAKKDLSGAEAALKQAVQLDWKNTDARVKLIQVQSASGAVDRAIATCDQGLQAEPRSSEYYLLLGELYQSKQDWNNARRTLEKARELQPGDPVAALDLANVIVESGGNLDEALALAQSAQRSMPNSPDAADTLGWVYYRKGEYPLALNVLQQALKLQQSQNSTDSADLHYHLGLTYQKSERPALARQHLERVLKIDPNYSAAADIKKQLGTLKS